MIGFFCAGNWKMNKSPEQASAFVEQLNAAAPSHPEELVVLVPALVAWQVNQGLQGSPVSWGGQNCYFETKGAFTGENSPQILQGMGAKFCLVGHSERRQIFAESDELISKKMRALQNAELTPILCVGETLDDRRWNRTQEVIVRQLKAGLQNADSKRSLWIAYEPVWAIGTGQVATTAQVEDAHEILRRALREWNAQASERIPILYGGSVKAENAGALSILKNVNGFLIGGASLDVAEFLNIQKMAREARG